MSNVITYKKVTDVLADIAARHYLINTFFVGEINDLNAEDLIFPVFQMYPSTTRFPQNGDGEYKTIEMTLKCRILDKQKQNGDDEIEIHNDTFATAQDVINEINQHPFYSRSNVTLLGDVNLNPLNEYMDDLTAGWEFDINLQLINNNSFCGLPMADITGYSASGPVSTGYSISFNYLQCDNTLSACTYLDWFIDYKINSSTGSSANYYTTGATLIGSNIIFNRNDMLSAYTVDLSPLIVTGYLSLSGGTVTGNTYFTQTLTANTLNAGVIQSGGTNLYSIFATTDTNDVTRVQPGLNTYTGGTANNPTVNISGGTFNNLNITGGTLSSGGTDLYSIFLTTNDGNDVTRVQPGSNISTGGTGNLPVVNLVASPSINNLTFSGTATGNALSANTISGGTLYSGSTDLYSIFATSGSGDVTRVQPGTNTYTGGTANFPTVNVSALTVNTIIASGNTQLNAVTATSISGGTLSGGTIYSGSTDLYSIFLTTNDGNDITRVQPGTNTYTGGTGNNPTVNISALTINSIVVSGNSQLNTITAVSITGGTISGGTYFSGSTSLYSVINNMITGTTSGITGGGGALANGTNTYTAGTSSLFSANISGGSFNNITVTGNTILSATSAYTLTILNSGTTNINLNDWSSNVIKTGVTRSNIIGGTGNTINNDLRNVQILGGVDITGKTSDTVYVNILTGASIYATNIYSGSTNLSSIFGTGGGSSPVDHIISLSDETSQVLTGTNKSIFYSPYAFTITDVRASLSMSGSVSATTIDVKLTGTTIFSTKITIDSGQYTSIDSATQRVITATTVPSNSKISVDITTVGTGATGCKLYLIGTR